MLAKEKMFKLNFKKFLAILFAILFFFPCTNIYADDPGYTITDYTVKATYHKNNAIDVKEVIGVNFDSYRHGIYRNIPQTLYINRDEKYKIGVTNIHVAEDEFDVGSEDGNKVIQIGDADQTIIGPHTYTITYTLVIPADYHSNFDFMYYSVLGSNWDTTIHHFAFSIDFEKALTKKEMSNFQIYSGNLGNKENALQVQTNLTQNNITGEVYNVNANQAITIFAKLRKNYFVEAKKPNLFPCYIFLILTILFGLYSLFRALYLKKTHITPIVTFYPPDDMDPAIVGTIVDESVDTEDLMALIPYWASKGYLRIEETKDDLILHKQKELTQVKKHQSLIFNRLFKNSDTIHLSKLSSSFGKTMEEAKASLQAQFKGDKILSSLDHGFITCIFSVIFMLLTLLFNNKYSILDTLFITILALFTFGLMFALSYSNQSSKTFTHNKLSTLKIVLSVALVCILAFFLYHETYSILSILSFPFVMLGVLCAALPVCLCARYSKASAYFKSVAPNLLGFKDFIEKAELDQLEKLSLENPEYYYDVIPYAMVFGLSEVWTKKFTNIPLSKPEWYASYSADPYTSYYYYRMLTRRMYEPIHQNIMDYQTEQLKSTANGLGSSFGGFSGGGAGGGGGSSW